MTLDDLHDGFATTEWGRPRRRLLMILSVVLLGLVVSAPMAAVPAGGETQPPAAEPDPPSVLVSSTGQVIETTGVTPEGAGEAFDPGSLAEVVGRGTAPPVPAGATSPIGAETIFGPDGRTQVTSTTSYPSSAIGQVLFSQAGDSFICTGWLIDQNTALTSGHCVHEGGPGGVWSTAVSFIPGRNGTGSGSAPFGTCQDTDLIAPRGWTASGLSEYDWGIIQLNCDVGNTVGWFGYGAYSDANLINSAITLRGYPGDKPEGTMWTQVDLVRALNSTSLYYQADTFGGQSGSPVYRPGCGGYCGVAVHSYGASDFNFGPRITASRFSVISGVADDNNNNNPPPPPPPPNNDAFSRAIQHAGPGWINFGNNRNATKERCERNHAQNRGGASVWWKWRSGRDQRVYVSTSRSNFDTLLAVYRGPSALCSLRLVASDDDSGAGLRSLVRFNARRNVTYYIAVDGYRGANGVTATGNIGVGIYR